MSSDNWLLCLGILRVLWLKNSGNSKTIGSSLQCCWLQYLDIGLENVYEHNQISTKLKGKRWGFSDGKENPLCLSVLATTCISKFDL